MEKIRRSPEAWIKSCEMDTSRNILIVEGVEDRLFFEYLASDELNSNSIILEIDSIDIDSEVENGNKGRVLFLASLVKNEITNFKCFVDKDYSFLKRVKLPTCVIMTDFKDLEAYLYEAATLVKFLKVGIKSDKITGKKLLNEIFMLRYFGLLRMTSIENNLNLSINATHIKLSKYFQIDKDFSLTVIEDKYIDSVLQNSGYTIEKDKLLALLKGTILKYTAVQNRDIVHGKDAITFIKEMAYKLGFKKENVENIFWMSFDKSNLPNYKNLQTVVEFLK